MSIWFWDNFDSAKNCHATYTHHKRFLGQCLWWKQNVSGLDLQNGSSIIMYCCEKLGCNLANKLPDKYGINLQGKKYFKRSLNFWTKTKMSNFLVRLKVKMTLECKYHQVFHLLFNNVFDTKRCVQIGSCPYKLYSIWIYFYWTSSWPNVPSHSDLDCRIVSKKDFQTSVLGQEHLIAWHL